MNQLCHTSFLQSNLNHCAAAQDLLLQSIAEWQIDVAVACEPYYIPTQSHWVGDLDGSVVVLTGNNTGTQLSVVERGSGYAVAKWGELVIIGTYFSPNRSLAEFETYLDTVGAAVLRQTGGHVIVLGDFNAKSRAWGSPSTDGRGRAVQVWALLSGLSLLNRGAVHTCVRQQGGSVVDLSFAMPAVAGRVTEWKVEENVETLSDHRYIRFEISNTPVSSAFPRGPSNFPRWCVSQLDRELAKEAAIVQRWSTSGNSADAGVEELAGLIRNALVNVCDAAMPRARRRPHRRSVYWWSEEIADLRTACIRARREYVRSRRRNGLGPDLVNRLQDAYRQAKKSAATGHKTG
ncbi:uncharacterized protein [Maniola hyperantus]|uniref:uncharacterized protein n=1 Tax=Aphantopus hyperantus TaxID=2795564 RepID=UPI003747D793